MPYSFAFILSCTDILYYFVCIHAHGIYPMVTSSSTLAAYGAIGAGIPPYEIKNITTVVKAYSSAVGAGAFVSEIFGEEADELRRRGGDGGEFGAT